MRREKETKQNKTQAEEHSILLPVAVFTRGCFTLWISIRATSHATLSWDGAGECLRYRRSATFPLPTDACTRLCLPSSPTKLQGHLWQPQTGHLVPPSSPQPPCQITHPLLWKHRLDNPRRRVTCFIWWHFPRNLARACNIRDREPCVAPRGVFAPPAHLSLDVADSCYFTREEIWLTATRWGCYSTQD